MQAKTPQDIKSEHVSLSDYLLKKSASLLRNWIRMVWAGVDQLADEIVNPMECFIDIQAPILGDGVLSNDPARCPKSMHECKIKDFFAGNRVEFERILGTLSNVGTDELDDETRKRISSLRDILKVLKLKRPFGNHQPNVKDCWNASDAILAVVAPIGSDVLTQNPKHFRPICSSLNKQVITIANV